MFGRNVDKNCRSYRAQFISRCWPQRLKIRSVSSVSADLYIRHFWGTTSLKHESINTEKMRLSITVIICTMVILQLTRNVHAAMFFMMVNYNFERWRSTLFSLSKLLSWVVRTESTPRWWILAFVRKANSSEYKSTTFQILYEKFFLKECIWSFYNISFLFTYLSTSIPMGNSTLRTNVKCIYVQIRENHEKSICQKRGKKHLKD